jgi:hypothetical protein
MGMLSKNCATRQAPSACPEISRQQCLDEDYFELFQPLLAACQRYASFSGRRFILSDFKGVLEESLHTIPGTTEKISVVGAVRAADSGPLLAAKLEASPAIREFAGRLRGSDPDLLGELRSALRVLGGEAARNAMISTFQSLDMWPPSSSDIRADDCNYQDLSAPLPVVAQRLYNDHARRASLTLDRCKRRAVTACFVVDFAKEAGVELPSPTDGNELLEQFQRLISRYKRNEKQFRFDLVVKDATRLRDKVQLWWAENQGMTRCVAGVAQVAAGVSQTSVCGLRGF